MKTKYTESHDRITLTMTGTDGKARLTVSRSRITVSMDPAIKNPNAVGNKLIKMVKPTGNETYGQSFKRVIAAVEKLATIEAIGNA